MLVNLTGRCHDAVIVRQTGVSLAGKVLGEQHVGFYVAGFPTQNLTGPLESLLRVAMIEHPLSHLKARIDVRILDQSGPESHDFVVIFAQAGRLCQFLVGPLDITCELEGLGKVYRTSWSKGSISIGVRGSRRLEGPAKTQIDLAEFLESLGLAADLP